MCIPRFRIGMASGWMLAIALVASLAPLAAQAAADAAKAPEVQTVGPPSLALSPAEIAKLEQLRRAHPELGISIPRAGSVRVSTSAPTATITPFGSLEKLTTRLPAVGTRDRQKADGSRPMEVPAFEVTGGLVRRLNADGTARSRPAVRP